MGGNGELDEICHYVKHHRAESKRVDWERVPWNKLPDASTRSIYETDLLSPSESPSEPQVTAENIHIYIYKNVLTHTTSI